MFDRQNDAKRLNLDFGLTINMVDLLDLVEVARFNYDEAVSQEDWADYYCKVFIELRDDIIAAVANYDKAKADWDGMDGSILDIAQDDFYNAVKTAIGKAIDYDNGDRDERD